ncbi:MAG: hypothetical protein QM736_02990 [Vicinamibacterales bacterium]
MNNLARKDVRMQAKALTHLHVVPHIQNRGQRTARDIKVGMYYQDPGGAQKQFTWTQVDTGSTLGFETLPKVEGGEHLYLEWQTDSDGSLSRDPGSDPDDEGVGKTIDLFELEVDQASAPKGVPGYVVFTVDLPDRSVKEANRRNNYDGFYFYVLDPAQCLPNTGQNAYGVTCAAPAGIDAKVPFPLPNSTLLLPDGECDLLPELTITQTIEVGDVTFGGGAVLFETGETAKINVTVTNDSDVDVNNVIVRSALGSYQSSSTSIAAHSSTTFSAGTFSSKTRSVLLSLPSLTADNVGFLIGAPTTLLINACGTGPYIVGLSTDPNPIGTASRVMRNGTAVRYFRAVNADGSPAANTTVTLRVPGITGTFTFTTDASGDFVYETKRFNAKGEQTPDVVKGVGIPFRNYVPADGTEAKVLIVTINGQPVQCRNNELFRVYVDPYQFTYEFEAGGAIEAGLGVFGLANANASLGGLFKLRLFHRGADTTITEPGIYRVDWERKTAFGFTAKFGFDGFTAETEFDKSAGAGRLGVKGQAKASAFKLGGNVSAQATQAYRYTFSGPMSQWSAMERAGFTALLFPSVAESDEKAILQFINDPTQTGINLQSENMKLHRKAFGELFEPVLGKIDTYKIFRSARIATFAATGDVQGTPFSGTVDFDIVRAPNPGDPPNAPVVKDDKGQPGGREETAADKTDSKEKEKSEPVFKADSSFSGKFHVTYEVQEQLKHELGDPIRQNPNAVGEKVVGAVHTLTFDTAYNYKAEFATNLAVVKAEVDKPNVNYPQEPQFVKDNAKKALDWLEKRIAGSDAAQFDGGLQFRVFSKVDANKVYKPWRLEVTFRGPKNFGLVGGQDVGEGDRYSLTFAVEGEARTNAVIAEAFEQAAAFRVLLTQVQEQDMKAFVDQLSTGHLPAEVENVSPKELYLWFLKFVKSVLIYGGRPQGGAVHGFFDETTPSYPEFYEEVRKGTSEKTDFGVKEKFPGKRIGVSLQDFVLDSSVNYRTSHGIIVRGQLVVLEDYGAITMSAQSPRQLIEEAIKGKMQAAVNAVEEKLFGGTVSTPNGNGGTQSTSFTQVLFGTQSDQQSSSVGRFDWRTSIGLAPVTPYMPDDSTAPPHKPHYGIGGFRIITSTRSQQLDFDQPATLTLSWDDAEIDGFPESGLRMFVWNPTSEDWTLVPASIDTVANTATATIPRGGLYTLGAVMPSGKLTFVVTGVNRQGSGANATTTVNLETASAIRNNDGTPLPAGTVMHVVVDDTGTVLNTDIDSTLAGTQVAVDPDGKVRLQISLRGSPNTASLEVFSHLGTVYGAADAPLP